MKLQVHCKIQVSNWVFIITEHMKHILTYISRFIAGLIVFLFLLILSGFV